MLEFQPSVSHNYVKKLQFLSSVVSYFRALQVLLLLSRALETDPTSVTLWITYLLIYYSNRNSRQKDDMFSYAVCYFLFPSLTSSVLWRLGSFCMCGDSPIGVAIQVGNSKKTLEISILYWFLFITRNSIYWW